MIRYIDGVYCKVTDPDAIQPIWDLLQYKSYRYSRGQFGESKKHEQIQSMLDKRNGRFLTGFLPRIAQEILRLGIGDYHNKEFQEALRSIHARDMHEPELKGITLRPDQREMLRALSNFQRGVFQAATGSGKTVLAAACHSMHRGRTLFLCHTVDLLMQAAEEFRKMGFPAYEIGAGNKELPALEENAVVTATVQTYANLKDILEYVETFDCIIVDECHHVIDKDGLYARIFERSLAPIRIGLTATLPQGKHEQLIMEGYIGQVIGQFLINDGVEQGILAKPIVEWIPVPVQDRIVTLERYRDIYFQGIVNNRARNRLVMREAEYEISKGRTVLIIVKEIEHGENLVEMGKLFGLDPFFVFGGTKRNVRKEVKQALEEKSLPCVISTAWKEGINIRSLNCVINAAGGKSEIATMQAIGRGLRTTENKTQVVIKDFVDPYKYLSHHCMLRLTLYAENGWNMRGIPA